ncbi:MAG: hypothetical protein J3T61_10740, partial [Candidatus Brocadiales bacterium]|nr:hypothetical protein [Candidatus Bathyanammoxibius sp.]
KLLDNPDIATQDNVIDELKDSVFEVVFQDGTYAMLSLPELMTFTYQLIFVAHQHCEITKMLEHSDRPAEITVKFDFSVPLHVMQPEIVKVLLSKIEFSNEPSDGPKSACPEKAAS